LPSAKRTLKPPSVCPASKTSRQRLSASSLAGS